MILLLHTLIEGLVGLLFLFYPGAADLLPGFADGSGSSYDLMMKMYGLAALFLASLSLVAYFKREERMVFLTATGLLAAFHFGMCVIQLLYNSDQRAMLLHFLLAIFLTARYLNRRNLNKTGELTK